MSLPSIAESYQAHLADGNAPESYVRPASSSRLLREQFVFPTSPTQAGAVLAHSSLAYRELAVDLHARLKRNEDVVEQLRDEAIELREELQSHQKAAKPGSVFVMPLFCGLIFSFASACFLNYPAWAAGEIGFGLLVYTLLWVAAEYYLGPRWMRTWLWSIVRWLVFAVVLSQIQAWLTGVAKNPNVYADPRRYWFVQYLVFFLIGELYIRGFLSRQRMNQEVEFLNKRLVPLERRNNYDWRNDQREKEKWERKKRGSVKRLSNTSQFTPAAFLDGFGFGSP